MQKQSIKNIEGKDKHGLHKVGFFLSVLCAIHCLSLPIIIAFMPSFTQYLHLNIWLEIALILFIFLIGIWVFVKDYKKHQNKIPLVIFSIGLLIFVLNHAIKTNFQTIFNLLGGLLLVFAHIKNWTLHKKECTHVH